jgi:hypothetical protein
MNKIIIQLFFLFSLLAFNSCSSEINVNGSEENNYPFVNSPLSKIDSLILTRTELPEITNYANFDSTTITMFHTLAQETNGKLYMYENVIEINSTIVEIIENHGADDIDLCFLIDKTGSMVDDIAVLQSGTNLIFDAIKKYKNINVAVGYYGDKNTDKRNWLELSDFSKDFDKIEREFKKVKYSGGGDYPESVTDAAFTAVEKLNWSSSVKRVLLILGDAPSLLPPKAEYNIKDLVTQANDKDIIFNYYPVVVGIQGSIPGPKKMDIIANLYPVPAKDILNVVFENEDELKVEIFDMEANMVKEFETNNQKVQINLSDLEDGTYILRVRKNNGSIVDSQKFIVQK